MLRRLVLLVAALTLAVSATAVAAPAPAASASFKSEYTPVNARLVVLGKDIATAVQGADTKTDVQLGRQFAGLASRTTKAAAAVVGVRGASSAQRAAQVRLADKLVKTAGDLAGIASAAAGHDAKAARAAATRLATHYQQVGVARRSLAKSLGLS